MQHQVKQYGARIDVKVGTNLGATIGSTFGVKFDANDGTLRAKVVQENSATNGA